MYMAAKTKVTTVVTSMFRKRAEAGPFAKRVYNVLENNAERGRMLAHSRRHMHEHTYRRTDGQMSA